jgi:hypothetical protein
MNYLWWFLAFVLGTGLLICLVWVGCFIADSLRYKRALNRRMRQVDAEMKKRGGIL